MTPTPEKGWKYYLGLTLFAYSLATIPLAALCPWLFSAAVAAAVVTGVVISGEVGFWVSAALLGKPFVEALKAKLKGWFARPAAPPRPVGRGRHAFGLVLFSLSFVTYYVALSIPFLGWERRAALAGIVVVALSGELLFLASLFVLGGEFWERLKALYRWPGPAPEAPAGVLISPTTLQEVTEVAVIKHPPRGVLLLHSPRRRWHFPDATVEAPEAWDDSLRRGVAGATGITDLAIQAVLKVQNFAPGVVDGRAQYGVFFLCSTQAGDVRLGLEDDQHRWVADGAAMDGLALFHPLVAELVAEALRHGAPPSPAAQPTGALPGGGRGE
jgi:hypothetical protein